MLFWYVGGSIWIFRYVFKDPAVDLRALALGAIAPDLVDKPIAFLLAPDSFDSHRLYGHTIAFAIALLLGGLIATTRGTEARKRAVAFAVGVLTHLLLAGLWTSPEVLFWPAFGTRFPPTTDDSLGGLLAESLSDPLTVGLEVVGLIYVVWLWRRAGLGDPERRRAFIRTGRIGAD